MALSVFVGELSPAHLIKYTRNIQNIAAHLRRVVGLVGDGKRTKGNERSDDASFAAIHRILGSTAVGLKVRRSQTAVNVFEPLEKKNRSCIFLHGRRNDLVSSVPTEKDATSSLQAGGKVPLSSASHYGDPESSESGSIRLNVETTSIAALYAERCRDSAENRWHSFRRAKYLGWGNWLSPSARKQL